MDILLADLGPGIPGESTLPGYTNQIELLSWSYGFTGAAQPPSSPQSVSLSKYMDSSSTALLSHCMAATSLPSVSITIATMQNNSVTQSMTITFTDVLIASISASGGGGDKPVETISLNYKSITIHDKR